MHNSMFRILLALGAALCSGSLFANVTAIDFPGGPAGMINGSVTLPGGDTVPVVTRDQCEQQKAAGDECSDDHALFIVTGSALDSGSRLTVNYTTPGGERMTMPLFVGADGIARSGGATPSTPSTASPGMQYPGLYLNAGIASVDSPEANYGVRADLGASKDFPLFRIGDNLDGWGVQIGGSPALGMRRLSWNIGYTDASDDGNREFSSSELGGNGRFGWFYFDPAGGSTGFGDDGTVFTDLRLRYDIDFERTSFDFAIGEDRLNWRECTWTPMIGLRGSQSEFDIRSRLEFDGPFYSNYEFSSTARQRLETDSLGLGIGVAGHTPEGYYPLNFSYQVMLFGDWVDHSLKSEQLNICELCGSPEDEYPVQASSSEDKFGLGGTIRLSASLPLAEGLSIGGYVAGDYSSVAPKIRNSYTQSTSAAGPRVDTGSSFDWQAGLTFQYQY